MTILVSGFVSKSSTIHTSDDDEYTVSWVEPEPSSPEPDIRVDEHDRDDTEPLALRTEHLRRVPADTWHWGHLPRAGDAAVESWQRPLDEPPEPPPVEPTPEPRREEWHSIFDELIRDAPPVPKDGPIGFAHNGFHVDDERRFQPLRRPDPGGHSRHASRHASERRARHQQPEDKSDVSPLWPRAVGRHSRIDPDDAPSHGRHSMPGHD